MSLARWYEHGTGVSRSRDGMTWAAGLGTWAGRETRTRKVSLACWYGHGADVSGSRGGMTWAGGLGTLTGLNTLTGREKLAGLATRFGDVLNALVHTRGNTCDHNIAHQSACVHDDCLF